MGAYAPLPYEIIVPFGLYHWISIRGGIIIAVQYESQPNEYGVREPAYSALLNLYGEYIIPLGTFNRIIQVGDNFVVVQDKQGNPGVYDFSGSPIIPTGKYEVIRVVHNNTVVVRNHEGWGAVNLDGSIIIPFGVYGSIVSVGESANRLFLTYEQGRTDARELPSGIRDSEGNVLIAAGQFNAVGKAQGLYYGMVLFRQSGSNRDRFDDTLFNIETGEIVSFPTQGLEFWDGLRIIKPGYAMTGHGIFNFNGERISPENLFFHPQHCSERWLLPVSQDNRAGIYNFHTNEIFWLGSGLRVTNISYPLISYHFQIKTCTTHPIHAII